MAADTSIWCESFDKYAEDATAGAWTSWANSFDLVSGITGMHGYCIRSDTAFNTIQKTMAAASRWVISQRIMTTLLESNPFLQLRLGSTTQMEVFNTASGYLAVRRLGAAGADVAASVPTPINVATWVELVVDLATTATGAWQLYIGRDLVASESNVVTATVSASADNVRWGRPAGSSGTYYFDDLVIQTGADKDRLLDCPVMARRITADTLLSGWTPSSGSDGYAMLADKSDATYLSALSTGSRFYGPLEDETTLNHIHFVQWSARASETEAASRQIAPFFYADEVGQAGTPVSVSTTPAWVQEAFAVHPVTGDPWTIADFNALETGGELVS